MAEDLEQRCSGLEQRADRLEEALAEVVYVLEDTVALVPELANDAVPASARGRAAIG